MSAYIVEDSCINGPLAYINRAPEHTTRRIVETLMLEGFDVSTDEGLARLGHAMAVLNESAYIQRYKLDEGRPAYQFRNVIPPTSVQAYKSLKCWLYQCTEGTAPESPIYQVIDAVALFIAANAVQESAAYENAKWGGL